MTTQADADNLGQQIGEIRRDSTEAQLDDAFGRINYTRFHDRIGGWFARWEDIEPEERHAWIVAAKAVRAEDRKLR